MPPDRILYWWWSLTTATDYVKRYCLRYQYIFFTENTPTQRVKWEQIFQWAVFTDCNHNSVQVNVYDSTGLACVCRVSTLFSKPPNKLLQQISLSLLSYSFLLYLCVKSKMWAVGQAVPQRRNIRFPLNTNRPTTASSTITDRHTLS